MSFGPRSVERVMAWRFPPAVLAIGALAFVYIMYRSIHMDVPCGAQSSLPQVTTTEQPDASVMQFLKQKVQKKVFNGKSESAEMAELDLSTKTLLSEVIVSSVEHPTMEDDVEHGGTFGLNYGVMGVIRRLVVCSAYRTSVKTFSLITLSPEFTIFTSSPDFAGFRDPSIFPTCVWLADGSAGAPLFGSLESMNNTGRVAVHDGKAAFKWMDEVHGTFYDTMMIHCTFPHPVGDDAGGYLYLNISHGMIGTGAPSELVPVYREKAKELNTALYEATDFKYDYAFCSAPSFTSLVPAHVKEFVMYHYELFHGKIHFFLYYSAALEVDTMEVLQPLIDGGMVTLVDFSREINYNIMYHGQAPALNDCLYRTKFLARWSLFWDLDEYFLIPETSNKTIVGLLEEHKDAPWISFGKIDYPLSHCSGSNTEEGWAVERMVYRLERPFCMEKCAQERCGEMCPSEKGMRKWIANPRKVRSAVTHSISDPRDLKDGVVLHTETARFNHYRGLVAPRGRSYCEKVLGPDSGSTTTDGKTVLVRDEHLAKFVTSTLRAKAEAREIFRATK